MEREENIRDNIIKLPKIELHCHLDGSLSREFVEKKAWQDGAGGRAQRVG